MSFRFDKCKPEDFALKLSQQDPEVYINVEENSLWVKREMYDFGWGNECGFMRTPKLEFSDLWELLISSNIQENKYGAARLIEKEYARELMNYLLDTFKSQSFSADNSFIEAAKILKLEKVRNRCETTGKTFKEIENDYQNWEMISDKVLEIIS